jgi:hypothetical protein
MKYVSGVISFWRHAPRRTLWIIISLVVVLVALRIALPFLVKAYVNASLNKSHDYSGKIGGVSMKLWRGGYQIENVGIFKKDGDVKSPLFSARQVDLSIEWRELFHGAIVGEVDMQDPRINIVSGPTPQQTQTGKDESWDKILEGLFPFKLNRFEISDGEVHFKNPYSKPPVDIFSSHIAITATNLSNSRDLAEKLPSGVSARGSIFGDGVMDLEMHLNLLNPTPAFELNCGVTNVNLVTLNNFLRAYGKFDVEHGKFAMFTSVASEKGAYDGYFKVFFDNLNVFAWEKERGKNVLEIFWQAVVGSFATIFKNHAKDQLAAKVPISGTYANSSVGVWTAIGTLLENAFIHALVPKLDKPVTVEQVEKTSDQK